MFRMSIAARRIAAACACISVVGAATAAALILRDEGPRHREHRGEHELYERYLATPEEGEGEDEGADLARLAEEWHNRVTYPTGKFDPNWLRLAALQDALIPRAVPAGVLPERAPMVGESTNTEAMATTSFTPLGPSPLKMTGCSGCYDYGLTAGRVNAIIIDPRTTTNGSIVAYAASDGGGVWKTTNCCSATTSWTVKTDSPLISTTAIDTLAFDPSDPDTVYAGTGDLNYGSFSFGSQGVLKSTDAGATWTTVGADVFGPSLFFEVGQFPQYDAVGKVRVDPNDGDIVVAGTKRGLFLSYDGGANWTGPCLTNPHVTQRQDITGLELSDLGATTRIVAAVGVRGFATPVQYNLDQNGANGIYKATVPASGCPVFTSITTNLNGWTGQNATSGNNYAAGATGNQLGRIDIAVAPSDANYIYAQVQSIATAGGQLAAWRTMDGGTTWTQIPGSDGASLTDCEGLPGDYSQNWYDQGVAVDPNNPNRAFFDTFEIWFWDGTNVVTQNLPWNDLTCGYALSVNAGVHVDQHALAFVPGSSSLLLAGNDGGVHGTTGANTTTSGTKPTWFNMDTGFNTIEFYAGDISGNFARSAAPSAVGGAQDNGAASVLFDGYPDGPAQWQNGLGGDGFSGQIDPVGTGSGPRYWQGNNSGGLSRCVSNCTAADATWSNRKGGWGSDLQSFILPINLFRGGIPGGDDCEAAGASTGCGHLLAATTRVWETVTGATGTNTWYVTNNPAGAAAGPGLTKGTLGNRSFINQVKYSPKYSSVAIVGTNDGNVQIGFNLGTGTANQGNWVNVTGGNAVLPNRPVLGIALDPSAPARNLPVGYAAVGGFNANTPGTPGHVFRVACGADCATFTWQDKTGNLPDIPVDSIIVNPNVPQQVYAGTDWGLYFTDDITAATPTWARFENGMPHAMIWDMSIDRGATTLSVWTRGRGAYVWPLPANPPTATLAANPASGIAAQDVTLTAAASDPDGDDMTFDLDFGDGTTHGTVIGDVAHTYTAAGTYLARLTVTDWRGASDVATKTISIAANTLPTASLAPASATVQFGNPVTLTATGSDPDAGDGTLGFDLDFGDGTAHASGSGAHAHTYAAAGSYTATLTVEDTHAGEVTKTAAIIVNTAPTASLSPANASITAGDSVTFTVGGIDPDAGDSLTYDLDFADGSAHGHAGGTVTHEFRNAGNRLVTLTVTDARGASNTVVASVIVAADPDRIGNNRSGGLGWFTVLPLLVAGLARRRNAT